MSHQFSTPSNERPTKYLSTESNRGRRLLEMQRRFKSLQSKQFHLKHELHAVERYLNSLASQIKTYESYEELSLER